MKNWSRDHIVALLYDYLLPLLLRRESASSCESFCDRWQKNGDAIRFRFFGALHGLYVRVGGRRSAVVSFRQSLSYRSITLLVLIVRKVHLPNTLNTQTSRNKAHAGQKSCVAIFFATDHKKDSQDDALSLHSNKGNK